MTTFSSSNTDRVMPTSFSEILMKEKLCATRRMEPSRSEVTDAAYVSTRREDSKTEFLSSFGGNCSTDVSSDREKDCSLMLSTSLKIQLFTNGIPFNSYVKKWEAAFNKKTEQFQDLDANYQEQLNCGAQICEYLMSRDRYLRAVFKTENSERINKPFSEIYSDAAQSNCFTFTVVSMDTKLEQPQAIALVELNKVAEGSMSNNMVLSVEALVANPDNMLAYCGADEKRRFKGAGTSIVVFLANLCAQTNTECIGLAAFKSSVEFYKKFGFTIRPKDPKQPVKYVLFDDMELTQEACRAQIQAGKIPFMQLKI